MGARILTLQVQARELGRLRTGYLDGKRPVRSETWIISSHAEHYVAAAAEAWGGTVEKWQPQGGGAAQWRVITDAVGLDAILPPGDPLSQSYELWSGGGCARRCDGITETLSDRPCLCRDEHGDDFHAQPKGQVCAATTRLNVFLPEMPDVGVFRVETHSWYAASEMAGAVDLIRHAVGSDAVIPIRLRIEQRQRKAGGQTKRFPVVVVELRGITTGQVLGASVMGGQQLAAQAQREAVSSAGRTPTAAIEAAPNVDSAPAPADRPPMSADEQATVLAQIGDTDTLGPVRAMWRDLVAAYTLPVDGPVLAALGARAAELGNGGEQTEAEAVAEMSPRRPAAAAPPSDPDELWARIMRTVPEGWTSSQVEDAFAQFAQVPVEQASAADMAAFLDHLADRAAS